MPGITALRARIEKRHVIDYWSYCRRQRRNPLAGRKRNRQGLLEKNVSKKNGVVVNLSRRADQ
jgi:hypothetical protein